MEEDDDDDDDRLWRYRLKVYSATHLPTFQTVHSAGTFDISPPTARQDTATFHNIDILQSPLWGSQISHRPNCDVNLPDGTREVSPLDTHTLLIGIIYSLYIGRVFVPSHLLEKQTSLFVVLKHFKACYVFVQKNRNITSVEAGTESLKWNSLQV